MASAQSTTPQGASRRASSPSTNQLLAYATQRAEVLFGSYRRGDANDPERYVTSIAAVLTLYDFDLIRDVTDPRTGIQTTEKFATFMPNSGELKLYCDAQMARRGRIERLASIPKPNFDMARLAPPVPPAGHLANVWVPAAHRRYAAMCEWAKTAEPRFWKFERRNNTDGIWIPLSVWEDGGERMASQVDWDAVAKTYSDQVQAAQASAAGDEHPRGAEQVPF